jgi:hypothetical protein
MRSADLLIAITDATHSWPELPRSADLSISSRADLGARRDADLALSAVTGEGVEAIVATIRERLVPRADVVHPGPWRFDARL